jgi:hypothetical protein
MYRTNRSANPGWAFVSFDEALQGCDDLTRLVQGYRSQTGRSSSERYRSRKNNHRSISLVVFPGVDIAAEREGSIQGSLDAVACGVRAAVPNQGDLHLALHTIL